MDALSQPPGSGDFTLSLKRGGKNQGLARALSQGSSHGQKRAQPIVGVRSQPVDRIRIRVQPTLGPGPVSDQALLFRLSVEAAPLLAGIAGSVLHVFLHPVCYSHALPYCLPSLRLQAPDSPPSFILVHVTHDHPGPCCLPLPLSAPAALFSSCSYAFAVVTDTPARTGVSKGAEYSHSLK